MPGQLDRPRLPIAPSWAPHIASSFDSEVVAVWQEQFSPDYWQTDGRYADLPQPPRMARRSPDGGTLGLSPGETAQHSRSYRSYARYQTLHRESGELVVRYLGAIDPAVVQVNIVSRLLVGAGSVVGPVRSRG